MNADEDYGFDVSGYLHVPQVLTPDEVAACNEAIDAVGRSEGMLDWPEPHSGPFKARSEPSGLHIIQRAPPLRASQCGLGLARCGDVAS